MVPIMGDSEIGAHIESISYYTIKGTRSSYQLHTILFSHVAWARKLHHYALKRDQLSLDLYLDSINVESLFLFFLR